VSCAGMGDTIHIGFGEQYHYWYRWYQVTQSKYREGYQWKNPNTEVITIDICIADFQPQACAQAIVSKKGNYIWILAYLQFDINISLWNSMHYQIWRCREMHTHFLSLAPSFSVPVHRPEPPYRWRKQV